MHVKTYEFIVKCDVPPSSHQHSFELSSFMLVVVDLCELAIMSFKCESPCCIARSKFVHLLFKVINKMKVWSQVTSHASPALHCGLCSEVFGIRCWGRCIAIWDLTVDCPRIIQSNKKDSNLIAPLICLRWSLASWKLWTRLLCGQWRVNNTLTEGGKRFASTGQTSPEKKASSQSIGLTSLVPLSKPDLMRMILLRCFTKPLICQ
jgi:hypothetical protein